jgi:hypothetical protein
MNIDIAGHTGMIDIIRKGHPDVAATLQPRHEILLHQNKFSNQLHGFAASVLGVTMSGSIEVLPTASTTRHFPAPGDGSAVKTDFVRPLPARCQSDTITII